MLYTVKPEVMVREMKGLAGVLQPFTPPRHPADSDISWLKQREMIIDGYPFIAHYSEADYGDVLMQVLTIGCKFAPFVPFNIVCKAVKLFMGDRDNLTLFEYTGEGRKLYSWMLASRDGKPVDDFQMANSEKDNYNGFNFYRADTSGDQAVSPKLSDTE